MSSRTCPDWPDLMEIAPELQFKHYTVAEALKQSHWYEVRDWVAAGRPGQNF